MSNKMNNDTLIRFIMNECTDEQLVSFFEQVLKDKPHLTSVLWKNGWISNEFDIVGKHGSEEIIPIVTYDFPQINSMLNDVHFLN